MKIECEVISVESTGDGLRVTMQGKPPKAANWRPIERQQVTLPATAAHQRAFYVGRKVKLTVAAL